MVPEGVTSVLVELWGGGGAGAAGGTPGGGGAGGSYARATFAVTAGEQFTVSVGAGGDGLLGQDGLAGAQTDFVDGDRGLSAFGGGAAAGASGGVGSDCNFYGAMAFLCRQGYPGSDASSTNPGAGGRAFFGSVEPVGGVGGAGAPQGPVRRPERTARLRADQLVVVPDGDGRGRAAPVSRAAGRPPGRSAWPATTAPASPRGRRRRWRPRQPPEP